MHREVRCALVALALMRVSSGLATNQAQPPQSSKSAEIVQTVGCAEYRKEAPGSWWLKRASEVEVVNTGGPLSVSDVDKGRIAPLGMLRFRLIGEADFLDTEGLLRSGERSQFTSKE